MHQWGGFAFGLALIVASSANAFAGTAKTYKMLVDSPASKIQFKVETYLYDVVGVFRNFDGEIRFDPADPAKSKVAVTIDMASIDTGIEKRDQHLRGDDFFRVKDFPTSTFRSFKIVPGSQLDHFIVRGKLEIVGLPPRNIALDARIARRWMERGLEHLQFAATTTVNRVELGQKWNAERDYRTAEDAKRDGIKLRKDAGLGSSKLADAFITNDNVEITIGIEAEEEPGQ